MKKQKPMKGQAGMQGIPSAALYLGIAVFVVAILITVIAGLATSVCTQDGGTEGTYSSGTGDDNPLTGGRIGCCLVANASDTSDCETWSSAAALNSTETGIAGLATFNDFWGVLVLIVILAIVIVALYAVFPRRAGI